MVKGMLDAIYGETDPELTASIAGGNTFCVTTI